MGDFFSKLIRGIVQELVKVAAAFGLGTAAGAAICLYYGVPLIFSLLGGIVLVALMLVFIAGVE
ncbi:hypothetical protein [Rhabdaerophilum sp. SD176]|uniref:hypothetical protein n=1 Tax=Rhabdaerophilum sp. SD176 TaxID=2983548 RepID=UPI0024DF617C|nr:hypothetical protein [Rhabdaerophilum sp. SD176]